MTLAEIPGFFGNLMVGLKLKEDLNGFNSRNIPSYLLDQSFYVELGTVSGNAANQIVHYFNVPVTLNVFFKGYRNPNQLRLAAYQKAHEILRLILQLKIRTAAGIKDIRPGQISLVPVAGNDTSSVLTLGFEVILTYAFQGD